ncbi:ScbR family autoregulator-binding transcription factor [Streptomyces sp. NBC_00237]|uniref:ScbR family autoregulator-binding transcription factor n=1 Tax=Streptomyces sp. NBC_00237 TaxID=2975687 RepID=UPI00224F6CE1|nr:ScbR family autoregulator-binding transcription factor [Streptomyces sp. NBC_00237]MCX5203255.1 ScbR family autoregulator-binding transcription factor [Streptomyces sp. NBC_00237]
MARQERAVQTRKKILVAAAEVFDEVGYDATTISEILKRAQVTKGALYFHFTSKEDLAQQVLGSQHTPVPPAPTQDLIMQQGLDGSLLLAYMLSKREPLVRGSVRLTVEQGAPRNGLDRRGPMQSWVDFNVDLLERAKAAGELLPHIDVGAASKAFVGSFTGAQVLSKIMTDHADLVERVLDMQRYLLTSIMVPGVLVRIDFSADRAERVYQTAMEHRREQEELTPAPAA